MLKVKFVPVEHLTHNKTIRGTLLEGVLLFYTLVILMSCLSECRIGDSSMMAAAFLFFLPAARVAKTLDEQIGIGTAVT